MAKGGKARRTVILECTSCVRKGVISNQRVFPDI
uniref:Ribosomal protein L33 n=3 Tax=Amphorogynaceae TaxID=1003250 RepID=A0A6H0EQC9_9MAGN|nr:ribosomal protein L33 [Dendrotrophe varians]YP_009772476.1 ribosomal protein L33 [Phacellaria compressa]YP_009772548.1 ribosomal protein L33 [Phacellaria glomerata]YP_010835816.1 ribosomal protein L33 [Phacellaria rigidula]AUN45222.1 ribosomal protein L33 [Dendrotrophe varians]QIT03566.1 ribosomal protein L33 [Phacellaria compressa]QIT03638.1 ribosomal protein L33 [Phacellaria glomerata]WGC44165.1 ribosomal protein L33 [Phacellaria rigidula]